MTHTTLANLALDYLGEPYLADYDTDTGTTADAVRLHLPQALRSTLEGHPWAFAVRNSTLLPANNTGIAATLTTGTAQSDNAILWTAVTAGPSGDEITIAISLAWPESNLVTVSGKDITTRPFGFTEITVTVDPETPAGGGVLDYVLGSLLNGSPRYENNNGTLAVYRDPGTNHWRFDDYLDAPLESTWYWESTAEVEFPHLVPAGAYHATTNPHAWRPMEDATAVLSVSSTSSLATPAGLVATVNATAEAAALVAASIPDGTTGLGIIAESAAANLSGGIAPASVFAPNWGTAFNLPDDCLRLIAVEAEDIDSPRLRWQIQGRYLLLPEEEAEAPTVRYVIAEPDPDTWPETFIDAVALLLAARLAPKLTGSEQTAAVLMQKHEAALGKARSKDARETKSAENHGPRQLAARSGLVRARYGGFTPPY